MAGQSSKQSLRQALRQGRQSLSSSERTRAAQDLARNLKHLRQFTSSQHIACYLANDGEIETAWIIESIWSMNKQCYLPVLNMPRIHPLRFAAFNDDTALETNHFGITEPVTHPRDLVHAFNLDLILLPLVGFDRKGNRLGMGGGYYDRSLRFLNRRQHWHSPVLVGLAYQQQQCDKIKVDPWDVPLDAVVTNEEIIVVK